MFHPELLQWLHRDHVHDICSHNANIRVYGKSWTANRMQQMNTYPGFWYRMLTFLEGSIANHKKRGEQNHQPVQFAIAAGENAEQHVGNEAEGDAVGDAECKWNEGNGDESRNIFQRIVPF